MMIKELKELVKEYCTYVASSSANYRDCMYIRLLEEYMEDRETFDRDIAEMKEELEKALAED